MSKIKLGRPEASSENKIVESLLEIFDFAGCRRIMKAIDWDFEVGPIPTLNEMQETCERLIRDLLKDPKVNYVGTGCFVASRSDGLISLKAEFLEVLEEEK